MANVIEITDFTAPESLVSKAKLVKETDCDPDAFADMSASLERAQAILDAGEATQSEVDAILAELEAKLDALDLDEGIFTDEEKDTGAESGSDSGFESDSAQVSLSTGYSTDSVGMDTNSNTKTKGCGASIAISSLLAAVAVGAIFVFKKKED